MAEPEVADFRDRLSAALKDALKARDVNAMSALRSALGAIANAEAVPGSGGRSLSPKIGVGVGDVARRHLSGADLIHIVEGEIAQHLNAASDYVRLGRADEAAALREQAAILRRFLEDST